MEITILAGVVVLTGILMFLERKKLYDVVLCDAEGCRDTTSGSSVPTFQMCIPQADGNSYPLPCGYDMNIDEKITNDPSTWPTGDKIWDVCNAIAYAEGYNLGAGHPPYDLNNPGDLSDGKDTFGSEFHSGSHITKYPSAKTGWLWLYNKVHNIVLGRSTVYGQDWTISQIANKWAGDSANWKKNVSAKLGVSSDTKLIDYVNG